MKKLTYICDRCKREFKESNIVQLTVQNVNCGDAPQESSNEFCVSCYEGLMRVYNTYVSTMVGNKAENRKRLRTGPMTPSEISVIMRMDAEGKSPEEIAESIHRTVGGIKRSITTHKNKMAMEEMPNREESNTNENKKIDIGGILALAKAGWTPRQIAGEHHLTAEEVSEILAEQRKRP